MHAQPSAPPSRPDERLFPDTAGSAVRVVDGYGVRVRVQHGRLQIDDGIGRQRRSHTYARATCPFVRLLVLGHTGYVSLEAVRWCHDLGIGVVHLDADRSLLQTSARREIGANRIRRVQALAAYTRVGVDAARFLLGEKLGGQAVTLSSLPGNDDSAVAVSRALAQVDQAESFDDLMDAERLAAAAYWERWTTIPIRFAARDQGRVADHWRSFGLRSSPVTGSKRHAINPANALLNYLYALLEAETTLALHASGLDPGLGIWHTDERHRDSLALDVMEAARPTVDRYVLNLLTSRTFRAQDFHETGRGVCRILPPLTHRLAEAMPALRASVEPIVVHLGRIFDRTVTAADAGGVVFGKPRRPEHRRTIRHTQQLGLPPLAACRTCGTILPDDRRDAYCAYCAPNRETDATTAHRSAGRRVTQARRDSIRRQRLAALEWDKNHPVRPDPDEFTRDILPHLAGVSYSALSRASGLSRRYCKLIATGQYVPHPVHWDAIRTAVGVAPGGLGPTAGLASAEGPLTTATRMHQTLAVIDHAEQNVPGRLGGGDYRCDDGGTRRGRL
jgi:CRISPR-associated endonuclease Cas1